VVRQVRTVISRAIALRALGAAAAAALGIDAYVHLHDAGFYDAIKTSSLSQGDLFRAEAALAIVVGAALLLWPNRLVVWAVAFVVAASALGAVLLYRYVDVGSIGPLPNMYEPTWVSPGKLMSAYAEGAGAVVAALGTSVLAVGHRRERRAPV
jgi:hypothetical protein